MEGLALALGMLFRIAVPLGLVALLSTILRRWDRQRGDF
jgi:hypothetical protein